MRGPVSTASCDVSSHPWRSFAGLILESKALSKQRESSSCLASPRFHSTFCSTFIMSWDKWHKIRADRGICVIYAFSVTECFHKASWNLDWSKKADPMTTGVQAHYQT